MKVHLISFLITLTIAAAAQPAEKTFPVKQFKLGESWVSLKNTFDFSTLKKANQDTLWLEICSDNIFSPFGIFGDTIQLPKSQLKTYKMRTRAGVGDEVNVVQANLWKDTNNITLYFFHSSEYAPHSYIIHGNIFDPQLKLYKTIQIGVSKTDFYKTFFNSFPKELEPRFRYIVFETCIYGIQQIYRFENNALLSVRFRCPDCVGVKRIDKY